MEKRVAVAAAPASEIAGLTTRLNKLEKRAAVAGARSANPLPPAAPNQSSLMARAEPSAPNETARSENPGPLLRDYSVEDVRDGVAVVDSRYGPQEVAPGDFIPGAGRVLRIEKRGGDWFVLTSRGVISERSGALVARLACKRAVLVCRFATMSAARMAASFRVSLLTTEFHSIPSVHRTNVERAHGPKAVRLTALPP